MKPFAFDYYAPDSLEEALALLADYGSEAKPLAGSQCLIPALNFRVVQSTLRSGCWDRQYRTKRSRRLSLPRIKK